MNAEAIMTPGGIADQLTRGLSGLGQSFNRREEMLRQGQRDRIGDDRYTAEMALRERDRQQQIDRQNMLDSRMGARDALADRRYGDQQAETRRHNGMQETTARDALNRQQEQDARREKQWYLQNGAVPQGVDEFQAPNQQEIFGRFGPNDPPEGFGDGNRQYTPDGQVAYGARQALVAKERPRGQTFDERVALQDNAATHAKEVAEIRAKGQADNEAARLESRNLTALRKQRDVLQSDINSQSTGRPTIGSDKPYWGTGDYEAKDLGKWDAENPRYTAAQKRYDELDAHIKALEDGLSPQSGPPRPSGDWKQRSANGFSQFVTP